MVSPDFAFRACTEEYRDTLKAGMYWRTYWFIDLPIGAYIRIEWPMCESKKGPCLRCIYRITSTNTFEILFIIAQILHAVK